MEVLRLDHPKNTRVSDEGFGLEEKAESNGSFRFQISISVSLLDARMISFSV